MSEVWSDWIEHDGKGQPVEGDVIVRVELTNGSKGHAPEGCEASRWEWESNGIGFDIKKYRILLGHDETEDGEMYAFNPVRADNVNHPDHYQSDTGIECIDAIRAALGREGFIAYCRGNSIKYSWRSSKKGKAEEDQRKAAWYSEKAAEELGK